MRLLYVDIDTLRADHLGCYGYHRDTSPNIDAVAATGIRFDSVYASDVPCLPSRTALSTGMLGIRSGVVNHGGRAADLRPEGAGRGFVSRHDAGSWVSHLYRAGWRTASISSFAFRHSAPWWNAGFMETMNLMRGDGGEDAHDVLPVALDWLARSGTADDWFLHVHLWDPHTPYSVPESYGNPFEHDPVPEWLTEEVRAHHWGLPGPHSAQEVTGYGDDEHAYARRFPRQPHAASSMADVKRIFDGYDTGINYADRAVGTLLDRLADLGVLDDTAVMISSDHGEAFGELGVYCDHQAADEATCHIPMVLRWPGIAPGVDSGLHYHLDVAATVVDLAGVVDVLPDHWDGVSLAAGLRDGGGAAGRDHLVLSQGAWSCQRGVRHGDLLYLRTWHDGFHGWPDEMLFDLVADPHLQHDLATAAGPELVAARTLLDEWTAAALDREPGEGDPMDVVLAEGGPYHCRGRLPAYLDRLRATGRSGWADVLRERHPVEAEGAFRTGC